MVGDEALRLGASFAAFDRGWPRQSALAAGVDGSVRVKKESTSSDFATSVNALSGTRFVITDLGLLLFDALERITDLAQ